MIDKDTYNTIHDGLRLAWKNGIITTDQYDEAMQKAEDLYMQFKRREGKA